MKCIRWLPGLCLVVATVALIGVTPALAVAEALDVDTGQLAIVATNNSAEAMPDALDLPEISEAEKSITGDTAIITNQVNSEVRSGAATVVNNQQAENATSGGATVSANVLTTVNTSTDLDDPSASLFSVQITGDTTGDIVLDDQLLGKPSQTASAVIAVDTTNMHVTNNLNVTARSGDAIVANNVLAGNATTGEVQAAATVVTILNSAINAQHSFLGIITVNGNLVGDILVPDRFAASTLTPTNPEVTAPNDTNQNLQIDNEITTATTSGNAIVSDNQSAGNGTSGNAVALVSSYNLVNANLASTDMLWVFINVLGEWDGTILNKPSESFGLFLGGGDGYSDTVTTSAISTNVIVKNNILVTAQSGNASIERNETAGNATSGDAEALVTMLNIVNSSVSSSNWFGILFINVFGTWKGNLGVVLEQATPTHKPEPIVPPVIATIATTQPSKPRSSTKTAQQATLPTEAKQLAAATVQPTTVADLPNNLDNQVQTDQNVVRILALSIVGVVFLAILFALLHRRPQSK